LPPRTPTGFVSTSHFVVFRDRFHAARTANAFRLRLNPPVPRSSAPQNRFDRPRQPTQKNSPTHKLSLFRFINSEKYSRLDILQSSSIPGNNFAFSAASSYASAFSTLVHPRPVPPQIIRLSSTLRRVKAKIVFH